MHRSTAPPAVESFVPFMSSRGSSGSINIISCSSSTDSASSLLPVGFLPGLQGSASTTGMMAAILGGGGGTLIIPVEFLLLLDLQYGGIVVQDGQNDLVHVLPQTQVDFLLLLQGLHQLRERRVCGFIHLQRWRINCLSQLKTLQEALFCGCAAPAMQSVIIPDLWRRCLFPQLGIEPWSA